nr:hypothetical protein [Desulfobulbaceae bacterium]
MKTIQVKRFIAVAFALGLFAANTNTSNAADNCAELLVNKCIECHNLNRVCQKLGKKSESRWERTVKRMVKRGTILTKNESAEIVTCLADELPGAVQACK